LLIATTLPVLRVFEKALFVLTLALAQRALVLMLAPRACTPRAHPSARIHACARTPNYFQTGMRIPEGRRHDLSHQQLDVGGAHWYEW